MPPTISYADIARSRVVANDPNNGPLAYSINRTNSTGSYFAGNHQRSSSITTQDHFSQSSAPRPIDSSALTPGLSPSQQPTVEPRRPSIAQVLSRVSSRVSSKPSSFLSDVPSKSSYIVDVPIVPGYKDPTLSKGSKKKRRPRNRRRRSSQTRDHADFIVACARRPDLRARHVKDQGPLLGAILDGNAVLVKDLIADKSNFKDGPDHRPLQVAALKGLEEIVHMLLDSGHIDINARDSRERTALFAAASRGHESVVNLLLDRKAKPLSFEELRIATLELQQYHKYQEQVGSGDGITVSPQKTFDGADLTAEPEESLSVPLAIQIRPATREDSSDDHIAKLEIASCENIREIEEAANQQRQDAQQKGDWVRGPLTPMQLSTPRSHISMFHKHTRYPGFNFLAPIVEFDFTENGGHRVICPTPTVDQLLYGTEGVDTLSKGKASHTTCRWYHLPANHLGWAEDLIRKIYEKRSLQEQKKRDVILRREPFYEGDYDHMNSTLLDPSPQARSLRPLCRNMTLDRDGAQRLSTALALHMPYVHWETEENRARMHYVMEEIREARKHDIDSPSQKIIPEMKTIEEHWEWTKDEKLLCAYLYNNPPVHPRRTLDQFYYHMLEDTEQRDQSQVISRYYHNVWKRNHYFSKDPEEMEVSKADDEGQTHRFTLNIPHDDNSLDPGAKNGHDPNNLFPRSTPDVSDQQESTTAEFVSHAMRIPISSELDKREEKHVMMVDQLWLWILDTNTIITCFPRNWAFDEKRSSQDIDSLDVLKSIHRYLALVNRPPLESIHDLAQLIVYNCLSPFCTKSTPYGPMQILDVYESAIASVTDQETMIFNQFATDSRAAHAGDRDTSHNDPEQLYNIDEEIEQLKEIKDIQDELHILSVLLENQITVLKEATSVLQPSADLHKDKTNSPTQTPHVGANKEPEIAPYSSDKDFNKLYFMVVEQEKRLKGLEVQAEQANRALNHLLDLKQKQANVSEARSARWTAESTKQQGNIMVLFTLVTIIFAPLSLMSSIFSLRIVEFPEELHQNYVLKYMFTVSIAVIVPLLGLVIYTTRRTITKMFGRLEKRIMNWRWRPKMRWRKRKKELGDKWQRNEKTSVTSTADTHDVTEVNGKVPLWKRRKNMMNGGEVDAEKNVGG